MNFKERLGERVVLNEDIVIAIIGLVVIPEIQCPYACDFLTSSRDDHAFAVQLVFYAWSAMVQLPDFPPFCSDQGHHQPPIIGWLNQ